MAKITYLLGAGASSGCLPIYNNFQNRFTEFVNFLSGLQQTHNISIDDKNRFSELYNKSINIQNEFRFHNTPDTIAKKYFHSKDSNKLRELKNILILFFLFEQTYDGIISNEEKEIIKEPTDKRYEAFIASLLKPIPHSIEFIENIHILTWNYDLQFEISFAQYVDSELVKIQGFLQSFPQVISDGRIYNTDSFSLIHLNGIAYARSDVDRGVDRIGKFYNRDITSGYYLLQVYDAMNNPNSKPEIGGSNLLSFAWENINPDYSMKPNDVLSKALTIAEQTEYLIIIGYSFPIFNRAIDLVIMNKMRRLKKVYLQTPTANNISNLVFQILDERLEKNKIEDVGYYNQFFIPDWAIKTKKQISVLPK